jgi:hypothetical protein
MAYYLDMARYSDIALLADLKRRVRKSSQKEVSDELGFSPQFVNDVLSGRRPLTPALALAMGYSRLPTVYVKIKGFSGLKSGA